MTATNERITELNAEMEKWDANLDELEAKARQLGASARIEYDRKVQTFREKLEDAKARKEELQTAGKDAWNHLAQGIEKAWNEVKAALPGGGK